MVNESLAEATLREALSRTTKLLAQSGVDSPRLSAELLLAEALGMERIALLKELVLAPGQKLTPEQEQSLQVFAGRRASGEPAAYILGRKEFHGRSFRVTPATLIPRPETELLVDAALQAAPQLQKLLPNNLIFADFGTGSGCIAITLALELPQWRGIALDKSAEALATARQNAENLGAGNLSFMRADFTRPIVRAGSCALIAANPPYVSSEEYRGLNHEVRAFEPASALVPFFGQKKNASGTEHARIIIKEASIALCPGGLLLMEIGHEQGPELLSLLSSGPWQQTRVISDLAGLPRLLTAVAVP